MRVGPHLKNDGNPYKMVDMYKPLLFTIGLMSLSPIWKSWVKIEDEENVFMFLCVKRYIL